MLEEVTEGLWADLMGLQDGAARGRHRRQLDLAGPVCSRPPSTFSPPSLITWGALC